MDFGRLRRRKPPAIRRASEGGFERRGAAVKSAFERLGNGPISAYMAPLVFLVVHRRNAGYTVILSVSERPPRERAARPMRGGLRASEPAGGRPAGPRKTAHAGSKKHPAGGLEGPRKGVKNPAMKAGRIAIC